jgi:hypothetical protein
MHFVLIFKPRKDTEHTEGELCVVFREGEVPSEPHIRFCGLAGAAPSRNIVSGNALAAGCDSPFFRHGGVFLNHETHETHEIGGNGVGSASTSTRIWLGRG